MGLLKWLKRDIELSPTSKRRISEPPLLANKSHLSRNESYLKALTKFNNWRQIQLSTQQQQQQQKQRQQQQKHKKHNKLSQTFVDSNTHSQEIATSSNAKIKNSNKSDTNLQLNNSHLIYEEINYSSREETTNSSSVITDKIASLQDYDSASLLNSNATNDDNFICSSSSPFQNWSTNEDYLNIKEDEPEYAIPFSHCSNVSGATMMFENFIEENFEFLNENDMFSSRANLLITDLDQSDEKLSPLAEEDPVNDQQNANLSAILANEAHLSGLMIYPFVQVECNKQMLGFNTINDYIQHGEIDAMEISYIQTKQHENEQINKSFKAMRKLRHPHILLLMGISLDRHSKLEALLVEPLKCSLYELIHFERTPISLELCQKYALQITNAALYLHKNGVLHTNICSQNIVTCKHSSDIVKLTGFELSTSVVAQSLLSSNDSNHSNTNATSTKYRQEYTKHFYQAPELLSEMAAFIEPTIQSDVYGICITLWEMLNCVIPYSQFSYNELIKVFSLRSTQLPIYRVERCGAFRQLLEKGMDIKVENRICNMQALRNALQAIQLQIATKPTAFYAKSQLNRSVDHYVNFGNAAAANTPIKTTLNVVAHNKQLHHDLPYERTSTIKRSRQLSKLQRNINKRSLHCSGSFGDEPCSPIAATAPNSKNNWNIGAHNAQRDLNKLPQPDHIITPNKKLSVNIRISAKCSPSHVPSTVAAAAAPVNVAAKTPTAQTQTEQQTVHAGDEAANIAKVENVKEEINTMYEPVLSSSSQSASPSKCSFNANSENFAANQIDKLNNKENLKIQNTSKNFKWNFVFAKTDKRYDADIKLNKMQLLTTEDFYIDDDIADDSNLGANFELNLNYVDECDT